MIVGSVGSMILIVKVFRVIKRVMIVINFVKGIFGFFRILVLVCC